MTAPTPEHLSPWMERDARWLAKAREWLGSEDRVTGSHHDDIASLAALLAAEHDAALEKAACECDQRSEPVTAHIIRAMKNVEGR